MTDFLLELLCEEIPARMQIKASEDLARLFSEKLAEAGLKPDSIQSFVTPRRLALIARGLPLQTEAVNEELKGPRADAPPQALAGFLGKTGLTREQLVERPDAKGNAILFAIIEKPGRATADVLAEAIPAIVRAFPWPKSMRWGAASQTTEGLRWVRPLQGIVAILGEDLVDIEVEGVRSGFATRGHRFHHPDPITIGGANDYVEKLRACHVIVDHAERMALIEAKAQEAATARGLTLVEDKGLVAENAGLTEWPVPLLGDFDPDFLEVPPEVIQLTLRTNQKYFVLRDASGKLAPAFICTANIDAIDGGAAIVAGNRKVLAARLSDARFFWEQDKKTRLEDHAKKLERITFHEKLGTVADKVERVAKLARWLVEEGIVKSSPTTQTVTPAEAGVSSEGASTPEMPAYAGMTKSELADMAEQAARLCKADLVTEMVGEFPELQGIMGGYYARAEGLPDAVADAIRDHYKPVGQGDDVPTAPVTVAVSLADKLDTLVGFFASDEKPTGSKDPYALRRSANGVIATLTTLQLRLRLQSLILVATEQLAEQRTEAIDSAALDVAIEAMSNLLGPKAADRMRQRLKDVESPTAYGLWFSYYSSEHSLLDFFADRLKVQQREAGVRHDLIDAVFALGGEDDLVRLLARVKALQAFVETPDGTNLLAGYKRAANILKKEAPSPTAVTPAQAGVSGDGALPNEMPAHAGMTATAYTPEPAEAALIAALDAAEPRATAAIASEDFAAAMAALATLREPIDAFFESVTVNDADPDKRAARLALLTRMRDAVHGVADFSRIEG
ncbi:MAG: glycine--tRNA ligase subunit beta [Sphingobium sp.]|uniref:glycine--tRNA ligase subunit beta n=1 Tax=Sphingobium sp. CECT 9361 TaxID=2845384 RepID=UPI001E4A14A8|nr:glycine--tRNA ligase subunit beta [Sphingobium sp. CECT 9361]CAH0350473.1 Glycine--tRNA ligase beta subunit [Sphingobium sp. CECT 9361]